MTHKMRKFPFGLLTICLAFFFAYVLVWVWLIHFANALAPQSVELVREINRNPEVGGE